MMTTETTLLTCIHCTGWPLRAQLKTCTSLRLGAASPPSKAIAAGPTGSVPEGQPPIQFTAAAWLALGVSLLHAKREHN